MAGNWDEDYLMHAALYEDNLFMPKICHRIRQVKTAGEQVI
jgi:hypothetical protein